jgi:hypothetical protein
LRKYYLPEEEILEIEEEKHDLGFALALAQWETKSLTPEILSTVEEIIKSGADLKNWLELGADEQDIKKRKVALDKFLEKIKSDKPKAKARKRTKIKTPIFDIGDCLIFKMESGNYGGAIVLATDTKPETACNLVATTRLNQKNKPTLTDFENAEVLVCNFGQWQDNVAVTWYFPDFYKKKYSEIYEIAGKISVDLVYESNNYDGKGYLFKPSWTAGWEMKNIAERQFESEITKSKPLAKITVKQLTKKGKWWKLRKTDKQ